jgi:hypothetical protein
MCQSSQPIELAPFGADQFVLRLAVRDQDSRRAETAVQFQVIEQ